MTFVQRAGAGVCLLAAAAASAIAQPAEPAPDEDVQTPWELPPQRVQHPQLFAAPTARLIPAGVVYAGLGIDSEGTPWAGAALGLGDVAEFGVTSTDMVRARSTADTAAESILPYVVATFRMGVDEELVFRHQPAVVLGFSKSFTRDEEDMRTRVAQLFLIASKRLGRSTQLHLGATVWDASLLSLDSGAEQTLHDVGLGAQLRGIFGVDLEVKPGAQIMVETFWAPEFTYEEPDIRLAARFAFGVRWQATGWLAIESGVSVPDIGEGNLLPANIFGQVRLINQTLSRAYRRSK